MARARPSACEAEVDVSHFIQGRFVSVAPTETQWVVARPNAGPRAIEPGEIVLTSNLETLRPGDLIDIRLETETEAEPGFAAKNDAVTETEDTP